MRVNVRGRGEIAVPQPLLNLLERDAVRQQERRAAVAQVVEADVPQTVLRQRTAEAVRQIRRANALAQLVEADVPLVLFAIRLAAQPFVLLLPGLQAQEHVPHGRHQRQRPAAGTGFRRVRRDDLILPVYRAASHRVSDGEGVLLEVDGIPA